MGRRALRKIDPELSLRDHLRELESVDCPFDANAFFGRRAPLEVEVGSGKGLFLNGAAGTHPDHDFVGIERARKYARFSAARIAKTQRSNALMIHGDGERFFREFLLSESVFAVHVYFPDPWWKKRHKKRRVLNRTFLANTERVLRADGCLHFWTDVEEYFRTTLELIAETTQLTGPFDVPEMAPGHDLDYCTHFERRTRLHGQPVYRATFRKRPSSPGT